MKPCIVYFSDHTPPGTGAVLLLGILMVMRIQKLNSYMMKICLQHILEKARGKRKRMRIMNMVSACVHTLS